jgi:epoxyqueuosine reductase QueG
MNDQVQEFLDGLFKTEALNILPEEFGGGFIFDRPLIGVAAGDDPLFDRYKELVGPRHKTPMEMWLDSGLKDPEGGASALRILAIVFPFTNHIRQIARKETEIPAEIYALARNWATGFMAEVQYRTVSWFEEQGYEAQAAVKTDVHTLIPLLEKKIIYSTWSERHMAFAAGLGSFSLHEAFISEAGCNIRLATVTSAAPLTVTPRYSDEPYHNCLHYTENSCDKCLERCPAEAITTEGHDKMKCLAYLQKVEGVNRERERLKPLLKQYHRKVSDQDTRYIPAGCAFCQFGVPCMDKNPMAKKRQQG